MKKLSLRSTAFWLLGGVLLGAVLLGAGTAGLLMTNQESFCVSCHEMEKPFQEYQDTIHNANRTGVRAICSDCHVPKEIPAMLARKAVASLELWAHFSGKYDSAADYEKYRYAMAKNVWKHMKETDSKECRNCHSERGMSPEKQTEKARRRHESGKQKGLTCIDCHFGIAHHEPEGPGPQELFGAKPPKI